MNSELREKERLVLKTICELYLRIGRPVSSGAVVQKKALPDSPATIRNIMAKLEELGYLVQPHASAGRVPTDRGLRFYVNSLFDEMLLSRQAVTLQTQDFAPDSGDFPAYLTRISRLLAEQSDSLGFVISPPISKVNFHHLRLIKISEEKVMIILMTTFNLILTEIVQTRHYFTQFELDKASQTINRRFRGKNLAFVRDSLVNELPRYRASYETEVNKITALLRDSILQEEREGQIIFQGASKLLEKAELFDLEKLKAMFRKFEENVKLAKLLSDFISLDRVKVLIGSESNIPDISDCALVLSHYGYNNQVLGTLGVIGPKRIPYRRIIPLVDQVAQKLSRTISQGESRGEL